MRFLRRLLGQEARKPIDPREPWQIIVEAAGKFPVDTLKNIANKVEDLNAMKAQTHAVFTLSKATSGIDRENEIGHGEVVENFLQQMPDSIKNGTDPNYQIYQMRYVDLDTVHSGTDSTLLMILIKKQINEMLYIPADDQISQGSWEIFQQWHKSYCQ